MTVQWRPIIQAGGEAVAGPNALPESYARPETTPLRVTVAEGENELPPFRIGK